jgi:hypothetical protein
MMEFMAYVLVRCYDEEGGRFAMVERFDEIK